ncbi:Hypothetical protein POVR1_LOCUS23 [uncultured virus]|nr:Hypothetical protein POVR1_LOCUS23 [uncultured virus]
MDPDADPERWVTNTNDDQFWSLQYYEHLQMISESLVESGEDPTEIDQMKDQWLVIHQRTIDENGEITDDELNQLHIVKTRILKAITSKRSWMGTSYPSTIDHMIREVEYLQLPKTPESVIALWLVDMCGHAAIDAAMIDPAHVTLVKKAQAFVKRFEQLKADLFQNENLGLRELLSRVVESDNQILDWESLEIPDNLDTISTAGKMLNVQEALTDYHIEMLKLFESGNLLTVMKPALMKHTIRESYRAEQDLEDLLKSKPTNHRL